MTMMQSQRNRVQAASRLTPSALCDDSDSETEHDGFSEIIDKENHSFCNETILELTASNFTEIPQALILYIFGLSLQSQLA